MNHREKLKEIHRKSLTSKPNLPSEVKKYYEDFDKVIEKAKSVYTVLITLAIHKILHPKQDIRRFQTKNMDNGFSARGIDTKYISPTLGELGLTFCRQTGWLTRSLEQPHPYDKNYPGKIKFGKEPFLELVHVIEKQPEYAEDIVLSILISLNKIKERHQIILKPLKSPEKLSLDKVFIGLETFVNKEYSWAGGAKIPVLIINSLLKIFCKEVHRYANCHVKRLESHLSADLRSKASGDIEIFKDDILFESYEIKLDEEINTHIVNRVKEKIYLHNPKRYFLLSSKISEKEKDLINKKLTFIRKEHGCQLIIDNPLHLIKRYLRIINKIDFFVENLGEMIIKDPELKIEHKKEWEDIYNSINQN